MRSVIGGRWHTSLSNVFCQKVSKGRPSSSSESHPLLSCVCSQSQGFPTPPRAPPWPTGEPTCEAEDGPCTTRSARPRRRRRSLHTEREYPALKDSSYERHPRPDPGSGPNQVIPFEIGGVFVVAAAARAAVGALHQREPLNYSVFICCSCAARAHVPRLSRLFPSAGSEAIDCLSSETCRGISDGVRRWPAPRDPRADGWGRIPMKK